MSSSTLSRSDLHEYQLTAIRHAKRMRRAGLFLSPGLGKTAIALTLIGDTRVTSDTPWLVMCPLRVMDTWRLELAKWSHLQRYRIVELHGKDKDQALQEDADIYLMNYDGLPWLFDRLVESKGVGAPFNHVVLDESQKVKDQSTGRWKMLKKMLPMFDRRVLLTGTPCGNGLEGLFTQQMILDDGAAFGEEWTFFRDRYFEATDYQRYNWEPKEGAEERIWELVGKQSLSMDALDYIDMPELTRNEIVVKLPDDAMDQYRELETELFLELENDEYVHPPNAAVVSGKLRQITQGGVYSTEEAIWHDLHTAKLDALLELIDELQGTPLLVLYQFRGELEAFKRAADKKKMKYAMLNGDTIPVAQKMILEKWNKDEIGVIMAHPATVSLGLNMQLGSAHNICWLATTWSLDEFIQTEARLWRQGQDRGVVVHSIVAAGTIDRVVVRALSRKDKTQRALLDALKVYRG